MRIAYLGPEGTFSHEALLASGAGREDAIATASVYEAVMSVHDRAVDRALVPIENSLEGSVDATLDALALEARDVEIVGELVHPVRHCLIARRGVAVEEIEAVLSHPQATAQCARFIRTRLPAARVVGASSTADAVRTVADAADRPWAALGNRVAADLYGCVVVDEEVEDDAANETRFVWLAPAGTPAGPGGARFKTTVLFYGEGARDPGWLVACLSEFATRDVNLTKIESRPRRRGLGSYMFIADLEGGSDDPPVEAALGGLRSHCEDVRVLGSYPAA